MLNAANPHAAIMAAPPRNSVSFDTLVASPAAATVLRSASAAHVALDPGTPRASAAHPHVLRGLQVSAGPATNILSTVHSPRARTRSPPGKHAQADGKSRAGTQGEGPPAGGGREGASPTRSTMHSPRPTSAPILSAASFSLAGAQLRAPVVSSLAMVPVLVL
jgi:hypothetical protein